MLGHAKSVKICLVQIHYKGICFIWIIIREKWIISLSFARQTCAYPATHSFLKKCIISISDRSVSSTPVSRSIASHLKPEAVK
nr:unnamed protein product [Callosobruchus analis]